MLLMTIFLVGHMEVGNQYCRTDMMIANDPIAIEYPCEYYSELKDIDKLFKELGE